MIVVYLQISHAIEQQLPQAEPEPEQLEELEQPPQAELELYQDIITKSLASKICLYDIVGLTL